MENKNLETSPKVINTEQQIKQPIQEKTETKPLIKTNWKFIAIVVALAVLVGGGTLWYVRLFNQQISELETSNVTLQIPKEKKSEIDISGWQTYRNDEFGFEVEYPPFYEIWFELKEPRTDPDIAFAIIFRAKEEYLDKFQNWGIGIYKGELKKGAQIGDIAAYVTSDNCEQVFSVVSNSIPVLRCIQEGDTGKGDFAFYPRELYFISPSSRLFEVNYLHLDMYGNEELIKQILSTFRFTK